MTARRYPCLECERPTASEDRYVVCDDCLEELEWDLREQRRERAAAYPRSPDGRRGARLSGRGE